MKTFLNDLTSKSELDLLIQQAVKPTIISISRSNSFGAHWLNRILELVKNKYQERIIIHAFYLDQPDRVMSVLGERRTIITYFVKEQEIKDIITGSVAKAIFNKKLIRLLS